MNCSQLTLTFSCLNPTFKSLSYWCRTQAPNIPTPLRISFEMRLVTCPWLPLLASHSRPHLYLSSLIAVVGCFCTLLTSESDFTLGLKLISLSLWDELVYEMWLSGLQWHPIQGLGTHAVWSFDGHAVCLSQGSVGLGLGADGSDELFGFCWHFAFFFHNND